MIFFQITSYAVCQQSPPEIRLPIGHSNTINCVAISHDSRLIATGGEDKSIIIWDAKSGVPIKRLDSKSNSIQKIFFTPDDKSLLVVRAFDEFGLNSNTLYQLWNIETGQLTKQFSFDGTPKVEFSNDGKNILIFGFFSSSTVNSVFYRSEVFLNLKNLTAWSIENNKVLGTYSYLGKTDLYDDAAFQFKFLFDPSWFITVTKQSIPESYKNKYLLNIGNLLQGNDKKPVSIIDLGEEPVMVASSPYSPLIITSSQNKMKLWSYTFPNNGQVPHFSERADFDSIIGKINSIEFSNENTLLVESKVEGKNRITLLNLKSEIPETTLIQEDSFFTEQVKIAPNGKYFIVLKDKDAYQYSYGGELLRKFANKVKPTYNAFLSQDNKYLYTYHGGPYLDKNYPLYDSMKFISWVMTRPALRTAETEEVRKAYQTYREKSGEIEEEKKKKNDSRSWNLEYGRVDVAKDSGIDVEYNPIVTGNKYAIIKDTKYTGFFDIFNGIRSTMNMMEKLSVAQNDSKYFFDLSRVISNYNLLAKDTTSFLNRTYGPLLKFINKASNDTLTFVAIDSADWIILTSAGYYMSSPGGAKTLSYIVNNNVYLFEQFDLQYNRPDIVLSKLGVADSSTINLYRKAYEKRLQALHIDEKKFEKERSFNVPVVEIQNEGDLPLISRNKSVEITISAVDSLNVLDRINIWVNGVPLYGKNGMPLIRQQLHHFLNTFSIPLCTGNNIIEVSALNNKAVESYRQQVQIKSKPTENIKPKLYFVGIGVEKYADQRYNLKYSTKDIRDLEKALKNKYPEAITSILLDEQVTRENVLALKNMLLKTSVDDKIIVSISGHGLLDSNFNFYAATYDIDFSNPGPKGIDYNDLQNLLDSVPARQKLLLIDACHSGEIDNESIAKIEDKNKLSGSRGVIISTTQKTGKKNSFELMQQIFVNVGRGSGATVIAGAAGKQSAFEKSDLKNGVFTYCILELLKSKQSLLISEMVDYVIRKVPELTYDTQNPVVRSENVELDWSVW